MGSKERSKWVVRRVVHKKKSLKDQSRERPVQGGLKTTNKHPKKKKGR
jgi:hypothetical protein